MPKGAVTILVALVLMVVFMVMLVQTMFIVDRLVAVDQVIGTAEYARGESRPAPLREGMLLQVGDTVTTAADSYVGIRWVDGTRAKIGPKTALVLKRSRADKLRKTEETRLRLNWGQVWFRVRRIIKGDSKFEVETPAVVAAVRGTVFSVTVSPGGQTAVSVYEGKVALQAGGDNALVGPRTEASADGRVGINTLRMSETALAAWRHQEGVVGPLLTLSEPGEAPLRTTDPYLVVSGKTEPGVKVEVLEPPANDTARAEFATIRKVVVDRQGAFTARIPLVEGDNHLLVAASDPDRRRTEIRRTVFYTSPAARMTVHCAPDTLPADGTGKATVSVTVLDADGHPVPDGTPVRFAGMEGLPGIARTVGGVAKVECTADRPGNFSIVAASGAASASAGVTARISEAAPAEAPEGNQAPERAPDPVATE